MCVCESKASHWLDLSKVHNLIPTPLHFKNTKQKSYCLVSKQCLFCINNELLF